MALVIRGLFICGFAVQKLPFLKNPSCNLRIILVFLFAVLNKKDVSTFDNERNLDEIVPLLYKGKEVTEI